MNKVYKTILFVCILLSLFVFSKSKLYASGISFSASPTVTMLRAQSSPSQVLLHLQNLADVSLTLSLNLRPFLKSDEQGKIIYLSQTDPKWNNEDTFLKSITIKENGNTTDSILLGPAEKKDVTIIIPAQDTNADHYFSVLFISTPPITPLKNATLLKGAIATHILYSSHNETPNMVTIENLQATTPSSIEPVHIRFTLQNTGSSFISFAGSITIKNIFGQPVAEVPVQTVVLANSVRTYEATTKEKMFIGPYTITLSLTSDKNTAIKKEFRIFCVPFQIAFVLGILFIFAVFVVVRIRRYYR